jgi:uncharacterized damage-inducible protein DinB
MERREILKSIGLISPLALIPVLNLDNSNNTNSWLKEFADRWEISELYNREVFNAMPEDYLDFKRVPEVKSFGKQFSHLSMGISGYAAIIRGHDGLEKPDIIDRKIIFNYLENYSAEFNSMLNDLDEELLYSKDHKYKDEEMWKNFSITDILLLAYDHTTHHRGQAIVYFRIKGIEPPKYLF